MITNIKLSSLALVFLGLSVISCDKKEKKTDEAVETEKVETTAPLEGVTADSAVSFGKFEFSEVSHDFGNITQGDSVMHTFKFTNVGDAPLLISVARGSCGCTVPDYPKTPIPVGKTGDILVKFNSRGKKGAQNKTVTLTANTDPQNTVLTITSFVEVPNK